MFGYFCIVTMQTLLSRSLLKFPRTSSTFSPFKIKLHIQNEIIVFQTFGQQSYRDKTSFKPHLHQQIRKMKIYTKTGDTGTSGLFNGERRQKDDDIFEALGVCDELNASLGIAMEHCELAEQKEVCFWLEEISSRLFDVGSAIATPVNTTESKSKLAHTSFDEKHIEWLEKLIDQMDLELPELKNFILPSGGLAACNLHLARTLARRAERRVWPLIRTGQCDPVVGKYLNRLSDFLFTTARLVSQRTGAKEKIYKKARVLSSE
jgi:cob(I)alamin adenosyltransferase